MCGFYLAYLSIFKAKKAILRGKHKMLEQQTNKKITVCRFGKTVFVSSTYLKNKFKFTSAALSQKLKKWQIYGTYMYGEKFYAAEKIEAYMKAGEKIRKYRKKAVKK